MRFLSNRRHLTAATLVAAGLLAAPPLLFAHARLLRSTPAADSRLDSAPTTISLWFSERPESRFTRIQLVDAAGISVPLGAVAILAANPPGVSVPIGRPLARGRYTVVWRTAAADGHPSSGRFSFDVTTAASDTAVRKAPIPAPTSPPVSNAVVASERAATISTGIRWAELVSVVTLIGTIIFSLVVLPASGWLAPLVGEAGERARRLAQAALVLFVITTLMRLTSESALIANETGGRVALMLAVVRDTRWGHGWVVGAIGAIVVTVGLMMARSIMRAGWAVAALGVVAVCTADALTGHSGSSRHAFVAVGADLTHYLAAGGWIGGLVAVLLSGLPALKVIDDVERPLAGARLVRAYHRTALECVTLVVLSALVAAWLRLGSIGALVTSEYGRVLLLKVGFVVIVLLFGLFHWQRVVSVEWDADTKFRFQRSATLELLVGAIVIAMTAVLVSTPLPE